MHLSLTIDIIYRQQRERERRDIFCANPYRISTSSLFAIFVAAAEAAGERQASYHVLLLSLPPGISSSWWWWGGGGAASWSERHTLSLTRDDWLTISPNIKARLILPQVSLLPPLFKRLSERHSEIRNISLIFLPFINQTTHRVSTPPLTTSIRFLVSLSWPLQTIGIKPVDARSDNLQPGKQTPTDCKASSHQDMTMNIVASVVESVQRMEGRPDVEELARRELTDYQQKMAEYLQDKTGATVPSALELRQQHAIFFMEALDSYRKNSIGRPILVWKLERELASLFEDILLLTSKIRKESFNESRSTSPSPRRATIGPCWDRCWLINFNFCLWTWNRLPSHPCNRGTERTYTHTDLSISYIKLLLPLTIDFFLPPYSHIYTFFPSWHWLCFTHTYIKCTNTDIGEDNCTPFDTDMRWAANIHNKSSAAFKDSAAFHKWWILLINKHASWLTFFFFLPAIVSFDHRMDSMNGMQKQKRDALENRFALQGIVFSLSRRSHVSVCVYVLAHKHADANASQVALQCSFTEAAAAGHMLNACHPAVIFFSLFSLPVILLLPVFLTLYIFYLPVSQFLPPALLSVQCSFPFIFFPDVIHPYDYEVAATFFFFSFLSQLMPVCRRRCSWEAGEIYLPHHIPSAAEQQKTSSRRRHLLSFFFPFACVK